MVAPSTGVAIKIKAIGLRSDRRARLGVIARLLLVVGRHRDDLAAERLVDLGELAKHVRAEVVVDMDDGDSLETLVERVFRRRRALQRVGRDGAEEHAVGLTRAAKRGQRRRRRRRRDLNDLRRAGNRGQDRDRHRRDDAADDDRDLLQLHQLIGGVDRDRALALRVVNVGDELAAVRAAGVVEVAERHLDGFGAGLPVFSGGAGQLHHEADGNRALVRARRLAERER
jgi:hypothetical protein